MRRETKGKHIYTTNPKIMSAMSEWRQSTAEVDILGLELKLGLSELQHRVLCEHGFAVSPKHLKAKDATLLLDNGEVIDFNSSEQAFLVDHFVKVEEIKEHIDLASSLKQKMWDTIGEQLNLDVAEVNGIEWGINEEYGVIELREDSGTGFDSFQRFMKEKFA